MILDHSVIVIKDGSQVLTAEVEPGDDILGTTYDALVARAALEDDGGWKRITDEEPSAPVTPGPIVATELPRKPQKDDPKKAWFDWAVRFGFVGEYGETTKQQLIDVYGDAHPESIEGA